MSVPCITTQIPEKTVYLCFNEAIERLKEEGIHFEIDSQKRLVYSKIEDVLQTFFNRVLEIRAEKSHTTNKIKFNRENIFTSMYCFAKKLYIGTIIDSEGALYPFDKPKHKIMGVPIKRSDMPDFCKEAAEQLAFDICTGMGYDKAQAYVEEVYKKFKEAGPDVVSAKKSISNYKKYITHEIDWYLKNGLVFETGMTFNAKCSLAYNYIIAKNKFKLSPINNNTKFNYVYVKPNEYNIDAIAYLGNWPPELANILEIDYETMFRKSFIPLFEKMFEISKWIKKGDSIMLEKPSMFEFFC